MKTGSIRRCRKLLVDLGFIEHRLGHKKDSEGRDLHRGGTHNHYCLDFEALEKYRV